MWETGVYEYETFRSFIWIEADTEEEAISAVEGLNSMDGEVDFRLTGNRKFELPE